MDHDVTGIGFMAEDSHDFSDWSDCPSCGEEKSVRSDAGGAYCVRCDYQSAT